jgi:hypothetical protein
MTFKRMMALGAMAAALTFTGCQDRSRDQQGLGTGAGDQTQPATGGSGNVDSTIPGASPTIGGTDQDDVRPGTELGGTGDTESDLGAGGSGSLNEQDNTGSLDHGGTGGSGSMNQQDNLDHGGSNTVHQPGTGDSLDQGGTGGSGTDMGTSGDLEQDQRNQLDDQNNIGGSDDAAR